MKIIQGYTNQKGENFPLLDNYNFESWDEFRNYGKTFITQTTNNLCEEFGDNNEDGYNIFYLNETPDIGFRVHSECSYCTYMYNNFSFEAGFLQQLKAYQPKIKLSTFPYGVISINEYVIGEVVKFYHKYITLAEEFYQNKIMTMEEAYNLYVKVIEILIELENNGIVYSDIHSHNVMVNPQNHDTQLIDFENVRVNFDGIVYNMICNLKRTLNYLNGMLGLSNIHNLEKTATLAEINEAVKDDYHIRTRKA